MSGFFFFFTVTLSGFAKHCDASQLSAGWWHASSVTPRSNRDLRVVATWFKWPWRIWSVHFECDRLKVCQITFQAFFLLFKGPPLHKCFMLALMDGEGNVWMDATDLGKVSSGVPGWHNVTLDYLIKFHFDTLMNSACFFSCFFLLTTKRVRPAVYKTVSCLIKMYELSPENQRIITKRTWNLVIHCWHFDAL